MVFSYVKLRVEFESAFISLRQSRNCTIWSQFIFKNRVFRAKIDKIDNSEINGIDFLNQRYWLRMCTYFTVLDNPFHCAINGFCDNHKIDKINRFDEKLCGRSLFVGYLLWTNFHPIWKFSLPRLSQILGDLRVMTASLEVRNCPGTKCKSTLHMESHYVGSIEEP